MGEETKTIDIEPKWVDLMPLYFDWIENGKKSQRDLAKKEILKIAETADVLRQAQKKGKTLIFEDGVLKDAD